VSGVPYCLIDAQPASTTYSSSFNSKFNTSYAVAAKAVIAATHEISGTTPATGSVTVHATITSSQTITDSRLFMALVEKMTTANASTNGEKEFHYVMMKMIPDAMGTVLNLSANTPLSVTKTAKLTGTHIEEMNDLTVVAWVQRTSNKEILQSAFSVETLSSISRAPFNGTPQGVHLVLNPARTRVTITGSNPGTIRLVNARGSLAAEYLSTGNDCSMDLSDLPPGCYCISFETIAGTITRKVNMAR
jgi:hypothetical protein